MDTNEFDLLLKEKFEKNDFAYKPEGWEQLASRLAAQKAARPAKTIPWRMISGIAASAALIVSVCVAFLHQSQDVPAPSVVRQAAPGNNTNNTSAPVLPANPQPVAAVTAQRTPALQQTRKTIIEANQQAGNVAKSGNDKQVLPTIQEEPIANEPQATYKEKPFEPASGSTGMTFTQTSPADIDLSRDIPLAQDETYQSNARTGRTSLAVTGGVNYGSQNATGYALGVNARRPLGEKFYLEGAVALINNNIPRSNTTASAQRLPANGGLTGNSAMAAMAPVPTPHAAAIVEPALDNNTAPRKNSGQNLQNLYYVQVTPSVGYQLLKKVSVSLGADMQRLLKDEEESASDAKVTPALDLGMTGKVEYSFSKRIKAGMMYREGVNNLVDNKYNNRNYLQLQFSWSLLGK